jgi:hypothetical protein
VVPASPRVWQTGRGAASRYLNPPFPAFSEREKREDHDAANYDLLASQPFSDSDTALCACALIESEATLQFVSNVMENFRKDDDVRCQPHGARSTAKDSPQGERESAHQFGVPAKPTLRDRATISFEVPSLVQIGAQNKIAALPLQLFYSTQIPSSSFVCLAA